MTTPIFSQLRILVDDFAGSYHFYRDVLGLEPQSPEQESGPYACFKAPDGGTDIALFSRALMASALDMDPGPAAGAVLVLKVDDVDATYAKVIADGAESVAAPVDQAAWGMRVAHVRAPEGTLVEFCAY
jgi:catechol 2,3-dioxygenase-like lactoylglutathione lyase family enzyme